MSGKKAEMDTAPWVAQLQLHVFMPDKDIRGGCISELLNICIIE